jgi:hypothetical protein
LVLDGVSIQNPAGAAINIQSGKRTTVTLVDNTSNRLVVSGEYQMTPDEDMKAAFFSEGQLIFDGTGSLLVYGNYGHAICSDDFIRINSGNITVNNATRDGIHCNEYFEMNGGNVVINAKSDGVDCEKGYITINGGTIKVKSNEEGIKSAENMTITGGSIEIESRNDAIRTVSNLVVTGGEIYCNSAKNGMVSTEGTIAITGGLVVVTGSISAFICGRAFSLTGGTLAGVGNATAMPTVNECRQRTVVWGDSKFTAGQLIYIKSSVGSEIFTFKLPKAYSENMALVFTSPLLQANASYTIYKGGSVSGSDNFHGLYSGAVSNGGAAAATFNTSSMVTVVGNVAR